MRKTIISTTYFVFMLYITHKAVTAKQEVTIGVAIGNSIIATHLFQNFF